MALELEVTHKLNIVLHDVRAVDSCRERVLILVHVSILIFTFDRKFTVHLRRFISIVTEYFVQLIMGIELYLLESN